MATTAGYARTDLIAALDKALEAYDTEVLRQAQEWTTRHVDSWRDVRDMLTKVLRKGQPITEETLRQAAGPLAKHGLHNITFRPDVSIGRYWSHRTRRSYSISAADLRSLRDCLTAYTGTTVTDRVLVNMGYAGSVAIIFNAANNITQGGYM